MIKPAIRKEAVIVNETRIEIGKKLGVPLRKCASIAVIDNIFAGKQVEDLSLYGEYGTCLSKVLLKNALEALSIDGGGIESYGKAAVVGLDGELEHGSALLHIAFNNYLYQSIKDSKSIIPSNEKMGPASCTVDVPLHSKRAVKVRTHFDAMEVQLADSPRATEIMIVLCVTTGGRPFTRIGGLLLKDVKGIDGVS
jgi:hypothetical protein